MRKTYIIIMSLIVLFGSCNDDQEVKQEPKTLSPATIKINGIPINQIGDRISLKEYQTLLSRSATGRIQDGEEPVAVIFGKETLDRLLTVRDMQAIFIYPITVSDTLKMLIVPADSQGHLILEQDGISTVEDRGFTCPPACSTI